MRGTFSRTRPERHEDLAICHRLSILPLSFVPQELTHRLEDDSTIQARWQIYRALGTFAREKFLETYGIDENSPGRIFTPSKSGFDTLGMLLSRAPSAYVKHCEAKKTTPTLEELRTSLKKSYETPKQFMDLPLFTSLLCEVAFEFMTDQTKLDPNCYSNLFQFISTPDGPLFIADEKTFAKHTIDPSYNNELPKQMQKCPAERLVIEKIWPAMIDLAVDTPKVFASHLCVTAGQVK